MRRWAAALVVLSLVVAGFFLWLLTQPKANRPLTLERTDFSSLPGWKRTDTVDALAAFQRSCTVLLRDSADRPLGGSGYAGTAGDWHAVCTTLPSAQDSAVVREWFEQSFVPYAVNAREDGLFTGYYEAEIRASRTRHGPYTTPIHGVPTDLLTADLGLFRKELAGMRISGHAVGSRFVPFPSRAEIDSAGLKDAPVLLYADDPVALFFMHIQGSGRARLDDGSTLRLAYAGQNGRPYTPIGRVLLERGALDRGHMSMQLIRSWLLRHSDEARNVMERDQSYVFFREAPIGDARLGSPGTQGVPLTPEASIAIDPVLHALGIPMYVVSEAPAADVRHGPTPLDRLCIAQDTGGAIKGPVRADIFWGFGSRAEFIAGRMKAGGNLFVLLPKALAARIGSHVEAR